MVSAIVGTGGECRAKSSYGVKTGIAIGVVGLFAIQWLNKNYGRRWGESTREMVGRWALKIPCIREQYEAEEGGDDEK